MRVDLSLGQPSDGAVFPGKSILFSSKLAENILLAMDRTHALFVIVTAVSVQLCSLLDRSATSKSRQGNMLFTGSLSAKKKNGDSPSF